MSCSLCKAICCSFTSRCIPDVEIFKVVRGEEECFDIFQGDKGGQNLQYQPFGTFKAWIWPYQKPKRKEIRQFGIGESGGPYIDLECQIWRVTYCNDLFTLKVGDRLRKKNCPERVFEVVRLDYLEGCDCPCQRAYVKCV